MLLLLFFLKIGFNRLSFWSYDKKAWCKPTPELLGNPTT